MLSGKVLAALCSQQRPTGPVFSLLDQPHSRALCDPPTGLALLQAGRISGAALLPLSQSSQGLGYSGWGICHPRDQLLRLVGCRELAHDKTLHVAEEMPGGLELSKGLAQSRYSIITAVANSSHVLWG